MDEYNSSGFGEHFMKTMNSNKCYQRYIVAKNLRQSANYKLQIVKLRN